MRSDFRSSDNNLFKKDKKKGGLRRLVKSALFIVVGVSIGFWVHQLYKSKSEPAQTDAVATTQEVSESKTISLSVELPSSKS